MKRELPKIEITPRMAVRFARTEGLKVTIAQASDWLQRNRKQIESRLAERASEIIKEVLLDITDWEWPDPVFNRMYRAVLQAIEDAAADYENSHNCMLKSESWITEELHRVVRRLIRYRGSKPKSLLLRVGLSFSPLESKEPAECAELPFMVELTYLDGKVRAQIARV